MQRACQIMCEAVKSYKHLCEGACKGAPKTLSCATYAGNLYSKLF